MWHHGAPSDCADSTACLFLLKDTKNLKNFNENPRELGIYGNNLMVPVSLASVTVSISVSFSAATTYEACHLFITTNQRTHPHKTDSTRARGGPRSHPKRTWYWHCIWNWHYWHCVWMLSMRSAQLSPVGSNRIGIGVAGRGEAIGLKASL